MYQFGRHNSYSNLMTGLIEAVSSLLHVERHSCNLLSRQHPAQVYLIPGSDSCFVIPADHCVLFLECLVLDQVLGDDADLMYVHSKNDAGMWQTFRLRKVWWLENNTVVFRVQRPQQPLLCKKRPLLLSRLQRLPPVRYLEYAFSFTWLFGKPAETVELSCVCRWYGK